MRAELKFTAEARLILEKSIKDAEGNEVFALGNLNEDSLVHTVEVIARGNEKSVLALDSFSGSADVLIHNHPSGRLAPSEADLSIASRAAEAGVGSYIIDNSASRVYVITEPVHTKKKCKLFVDDLAGSLEAGGSLAKKLRSYEARPTQLDLLRQVGEAFNRDAVLAAEAGTGVGKSFAYLVPALSWAETNDERVVISTATINLQQQLYEKDIPLVTEALQSKVKAVLIKGRGNYLCFRRLIDAQREINLFSEADQSLSAISEWSEVSETGDKADLSFLPDENVWSRVCSESDTCLGMRCSERERCFILKVRRTAAEARILVVNHHLLFADLAARYSGAGYESTVVLPPYDRVILDEAHNIEEAAASFFSEDFNRLSAIKQIGRLYRRRRGSEIGLILRLPPVCVDRNSLDEVFEASSQLREALDRVDDAGVVLTDTTGTFRLRSENESELRSFLLEPLSGLRSKIMRFVSTVRGLLEKMGDESGDEAVVWECKAVLRRLDGIAGVCMRFVEYRERPQEVIWIERGRTSRGESYARFISTPLDVAPVLREALYLPNKTVACVSATLTVAGSFSFWLGRVGLDALADRETLTGIFPSPFPYKSSVLLAAPRDAPLPEDTDYREFVDSAVVRLVEASGGSALVLFTSYDAMRSSFAKAVTRLESLGIRCLRQGDDDRSRLLRNFIEDESSVLFATDSFWEGVDAPGDTLRLVVLCRLPFRSPNEPVFEARREELEKRGENAFMRLSLPESVMKFKQGFGRLMRRGSDRGAVVVLDGRLLRKRYGEIFLKSLPETRESFKEFDEMLADVERFLSE